MIENYLEDCIFNNSSIYSVILNDSEESSVLCIARLLGEEDSSIHSE